MVVAGCLIVFTRLVMFGGVAIGTVTEAEVVTVVVVVVVVVVGETS